MSLSWRMSECSVILQACVMLAASAPTHAEDSLVFAKTLPDGTPVRVVKTVENFPPTPLSPEEEAFKKEAEKDGFKLIYQTGDAEVLSIFVGTPEQNKGDRKSVV